MFHPTATVHVEKTVHVSMLLYVLTEISVSGYEFTDIIDRYR